MDKAEHLAKLKSLKIERGNGALFSSPDECMQWIDNVLPLLRYDQQHYANFANHAQFVRLTTLSANTLMSHLNPMIGIVNQAITELEHNIESPAEAVAVEKSETNPTPNPPNNVKDWHDKLLGKVGIGIFIAVIASLAVYLIKQALSLAL
jgi:hypothetical protein